MTISNKVRKTSGHLRYVMLIPLLIIQLSCWFSIVATLDSLLVLEYEHLIDSETARAYEHLKKRMQTPVTFIGNKQVNDRTILI